MFLLLILFQSCNNDTTISSDTDFITDIYTRGHNWDPELYSLAKTFLDYALKSDTFNLNKNYIIANIPSIFNTRLIEGGSWHND